MDLPMDFCSRLKNSARDPRAIEFCTDLLGSAYRDFCRSGICSACSLPRRILERQSEDLRGQKEFSNRAFQKKMGSPLQESANLQMSTAAPDFCFSRAQRLWDVICAIWDLLRCTEICKSAVIEFSAGREICLADFSRDFAAVFFSSPELLSWDLGSSFSPLVY